MHSNTFIYNVILKYVDEVNNTVCKFYCNIFHQLLTGTKSYLILMIKDSTSSHTWAIFLLKRDFYEKSIFHGLQDPPKSEVQMKDIENISLF